MNEKVKPKLTDRQIKVRAWKAGMKYVFEDMNMPTNIYAKCSDGMYICRISKDASGNFKWKKWEKVL